MSGNVATATVETLTAEVRVLMVGSRQVTLSVYRQLDFVAESKLAQVFGRVRTGRGDSDGELVGKDAAGNLVASEYGIVYQPKYPYALELTADARQSFRESIVVFDAVTRQEIPPDPYNYAAEVRFMGSDGTAFRVGDVLNMLGRSHRGVTYWDSDTGETFPSRQWSWDFVSPAHGQHWVAVAEAQHAEHLAMFRRYEELRSLPLIVLAGLR